MDNQVVLSLTSGFIGSIIGALIAVWGSYVIEKNKSNQNEISQQKNAINAFTTEIEENLESIRRWESNHDWFRFNTYAWDEYKSIVKNLSSPLQKQLIKTYSEINRHNTSIDYHIQLLANANNREVGTARNSKQSSIERGIPIAKEKLIELSKEFEKLDRTPKT